MFHIAALRTTLHCGGFHGPFLQGGRRCHSRRTAARAVTLWEDCKPHLDAVFHSHLQGLYIDRRVGELSQDHNVLVGVGAPPSHVVQELRELLGCRGDDGVS